MKDNNLFKIIFSGTFILLATLMIIFDWFKNRIDASIIILFFLAYLPWLTKYVKSLEVFGAKIELLPNDKKEELEENVIKLKNKTNNDEISNKSDNIEDEIFESIYVTSNYNERLVLTRYEIEKYLKLLCNKNGIDSFKDDINNLLKKLKNKKIIDDLFEELAKEILVVLNKATHYDINDIKDEDLTWVMETSKMLINHLKSLVLLDELV